jgi:hypothetical protein
MKYNTLNTILALFCVIATLLLAFLIQTKYTMEKSQALGNANFTTASPPQSELQSVIPDIVIIPSSSAIPDIASSSANATSSQIQSSSSSDLPTLRNISGPEFQQIYEQYNYFKAQTRISNITITDNSQVDKYILQIAEKRGYKLRGNASIGDLVEYDGFLMQPEMKLSIENIKAKAKSDGIKLTLVSAYRSPEDQKPLFVGTLAPEYPTDDLLAGKFDNDLVRVMNIASPPGYSRHHTGYTVDFGCQNEIKAFKYTSCFNWISKNNYQNIRNFGMIPSYPPDVFNQGPLPEEWEYVWVGDKAF